MNFGENCRIVIHNKNHAKGRPDSGEDLNRNNELKSGFINTDQLYQNNNVKDTIKAAKTKQSEFTLIPDFSLFKDKLADKNIKNPYLTNKTLIDKLKKEIGNVSTNKTQKYNYNIEGKKRNRVFDKGKKNIMSTIFDSQEIGKMTRKTELFSEKTIPSVLEDFEESNRAISHDHYESELNYHDKSQFQTLDNDKFR